MAFRVILLLTLIFICTGNAYAQDEPLITLNLGDPAPPIQVRQWLKGGPITEFEKGRIYVIEFFATWCKPCKASMPYLSEMAVKYRDKVSIIGVDIYENPKTTVEKLQAFVDSMADRMNYNVATSDTNLMITPYLYASGQQYGGIPRSFVINGEGRLVWMGHPLDGLKKVLDDLVNNRWDTEREIAKQVSKARLRLLDIDAHYYLLRYWRDFRYPNAPPRLDSALLAIKDIVKKEPDLKYAPRMAYQTFFTLLRTNYRLAYKYGKRAIRKPTYEEPPYESIISGVLTYSKISEMPRKIFKLGIRAYKMKMNRLMLPELYNLPKHHSRMAEWYYHLGKKRKAKLFQQKAIDEMKDKGEYSDGDLNELESRLTWYKRQR